MLESVFSRIYTKFKLEFYQNVFTRLEDREASLTTVEAFCMETIDALVSPTINEFATFMKISPSNAAYKVNSLIRKGFVEKRQSQRDKREYHLLATQKYHEYYDGNDQYLHVISERMGKRFKSRELRKFTEMLQIISDELMPEIQMCIRDRCNRFENVIKNLELDCLVCIGKIVISGEDDHQCARCMICKIFRQSDAVHKRHVDISNYGVGQKSLFNPINCLLAVCTRNGWMKT